MLRTYTLHFVLCPGPADSSAVPQLSERTQLIDSYSYTQAGLPAAKTLQVNETVSYGGLNGTATSNIGSTYTYNAEGEMTSVTYPDTENPSLVPLGKNPYIAGPAYNYSYDSMLRLSGMTTSTGGTVVNNVSYNAANRLLGMTFNGVAETRGYNILNQLTSLSAGSAENLTYTYPSNMTNNGKLSSMYDAVSGETVTYTYDSLKRLVTASGSIQQTQQWGQSYVFDPFGNLYQKNITGGLSGQPSTHVIVNNQNQITSVSGLSYDANGNASTAPGMAYDVENRLITANGLQYAYDGQNKRVWTWSGVTDGSGNPTGFSIIMYSPAGQKLATYQLTPQWLQGWMPAMWMQVTLVSSDQYFGGGRVATMDQLGSVGTYFPWGEDKGSTNPQNTWSFATYWRDSGTNLDYANNRYYSNSYGRFMTPDPYQASGGPADPQSWNRYAYTRGDPVNRYDPGGTTDFEAGDCTSWTSDASLVGNPCGLQVPGPYSGMIYINVAAIAAAVEAAYQAAIAAAAATPHFAGLELVGDCYDQSAGALGQSGGAALDDLTSNP